MANARSNLLLCINLAALKAASVLINMSLPSWSTKVLERAWSRIIKDVFNFLEWLLGSFGKEEEGVDEHGCAENTEHNVDFPADVGKGRRNEVSQCEVEGPVGRRSKGHSFSSDAKRIEFWWVDPRYGTPGGSIRGDEEIGTSDHSFCRRTSDGDGFGGAAELVIIGNLPIRCEKSSVDEEPDHHQKGTHKKCGATTPSVNE